MYNILAFHFIVNRGQAWWDIMQSFHFKYFLFKKTRYSNMHALYSIVMNYPILNLDYRNSIVLAPYYMPLLKTDNDLKHFVVRQSNWRKCVFFDELIGI